MQPPDSVTRGSVQVRKERDLLAARVEAAEAELERERGLHRRELRRRAKEQQSVRHGAGPARTGVDDKRVSGFRSHVATSPGGLQLVDELARCKEEVRQLRLRLRQMAEAAESRERRMGSAERVR
jgi:coiled-coil domain-containing protein 61